MKRTLLMPAAVVASLFLSSPAFAQRGAHGSAPAAPRVTGTAIARTASPMRGFATMPRTYGGPVRGVATGHVIYAQSRGGYGSAWRAPVMHGGPYAVPRAVYGPHGGYGYRYGYVAPYHYYRPYYAFHPHFSLGFGLWVGYPVAFSYGFYYGYPYGYAPYYAPYYGYPYPYAYPYAYPPPAAYGYPSGYPASGYPASSYPSQNYQSQPAYADPNSSQNTILAQPGSAAGSISFEITPNDAAVIIDGTYVGRVSDLGPTSQPMGLKPGRHRVEIRAAGYQTITFDADVVSGQVLPYKGEMQPIR